MRWFLFSAFYSRLYWVHNEKHEKLPTNPPIHIFINRINNRLVFKIKHKFRLELQILETIKLPCNPKKINNWSGFGSMQYQETSEIFHNFTSNKSYAYVSNFSPSNLALLKTLGLMKLSKMYW